MVDKRVPKRSQDWRDRTPNAVKRIILQRVGKENAITLKEIKRLLDIGVNEDAEGKIIFTRSREIRMIIEDLVMYENLPICSEGGVGYWYAANYQEAKKNAEIELMSKARALWKRARKLRNNARSEYSGQLELM